MTLQRRALLLAAALPLAAAGCGFKLRQAPQLAFQTVALSGFATRSPLAEELRRQLAERVRVLESPERAEVVLHAVEEKRERAVVATTATAQVRELQLRLGLNLHARTNAGRELMPPMVVLLTRDMSTNETAALAKEQEEALLYREMQADVVQQLMRRLASIRL